MYLTFLDKGEARKLPKPVHEYMRHRFMLLPEYLNALRCFECDGLVKEKPVRRILIFNPHRVKEQRLKISTLPDLERYHDMLLYEGYLDSQGKAYVADRREPLKKAPKTAV